MRQIKFRAWIGDRMEYSVGASQYGHFYCYPDSGDTASFMTTKYPDSVPLMQFTGLLDKNGKEIYEGDILEYKKTSRKIGERKSKTELHHWEVFFSERGQWRARRDALEAALFPIIEHKNHEVVGNIYENPKLLTNTQ